MSFFQNDFFAPFKCLYVLLRKGLPELKKYIYLNSNISIELLPMNEEVVKFINVWKQENNGKVILCSASHHKYLQEINNVLMIFDETYGTNEINLKGREKLKEIKNKGVHEYDYIGDSMDDLVLWENAETAIIVNGSKQIRKKVKQFKSNKIFIDTSRDF